MRSGSLPDDWEMRSVASLGDVVTGTTPSTSHPEYYGGDVPFVCPADLDDKRFVDQTERRLTQEGAEKARLLPRNSVLVTCIGSLGKVGQAPMPLATNQQINSFIPYSEIDDHFAYWAMHTLQRRLEVEAGLQVVPIVNKSTFSKLPIPLPPLPEQRRIAEILDGADETIRRSERVIAKLREVKQGLRHDLLTRGVDADGRLHVTRAQPQRELKAARGWQQKRLAEVSDIHFSNVDKKSIPSEIDVHLCNYLDVYDNNYITSDLDFMEATATYAEIERFALDPGDVIITKDSETPDDIGVPAVVVESVPDLICGYHLALIRPDRGQLEPVFLAAQIADDRVARQFRLHAHGTTRFNLTASTIANTPIWIPPLREQRRMATILQAHDARIRAEEAMVNKLRRVKHGLMDDLLTGRVRV